MICLFFLNVQRTIHLLPNPNLRHKKYFEGKQTNISFSNKYFFQEKNQTAFCTSYLQLNNFQLNYFFSTPIDRLNLCNVSSRPHVG